MWSAITLRICRTAVMSGFRGDSRTRRQSRTVCEAQLPWFLAITPYERPWLNINQSTGIFLSKRPTRRLALNCYRAGVGRASSMNDFTAWRFAKALAHSRSPRAIYIPLVVTSHCYNMQKSSILPRRLFISWLSRKQLIVVPLRFLSLSALFSISSIKRDDNSESFLFFTLMRFPFYSPYSLRDTERTALFCVTFSAVFNIAIVT